MEILKYIRSLDVSLAISPNDQMHSPDNDRHYYYVGKSDLLTILNAVNIRASYPGGDAEIRRIFDFGCGHGRVTRWIRAGFRNATIDVTDFNRSGVQWCVENFDCHDTGGGIARDTYDLIWLGSVFTHLPEHIAVSLIDNLLAALQPNGLLIFTTQGRHSVKRMELFDWENDTRAWMHYQLNRDSFNAVVEGYTNRGYGYVDYPGQTDYGVCVARNNWYADYVLKNDEITQIMFQEKGADNHQNVFGFMRVPIIDIRKGASMVITPPTIATTAIELLDFNRRISLIGR